MENLNTKFYKYTKSRLKCLLLDMSDGKDESQNKKGKQKRISYTKCNRCGKRMKAPEERDGPPLCEECKQKWKDQAAQGATLNFIGTHKESCQTFTESRILNRNAKEQF